MKNQLSQYQEIIALTKYSKWLNDEKRRESFTESVDRYISYYKNYVKENHNFEDEEMFSELREAFVNQEAFGSMRGLMSAGEALDYDHVRQYNCGYSPIENVKDFSEVIAISMAACGFGFSVEKQYVNKLPDIPAVIKNVDDPIVVEDSKEGWAQAYYTFLKSLYKGKLRPVDTSNIRPHGAPLKTFGGRAAGPEPFIELIEFTTAIINNAKGRQLTSLEVHDIVCMCGQIVVAGGVRRSALISLSDLEDEDMRHAKSGAWWEKNGQRQMANNSIAFKTKPTREEFDKEFDALIASYSGERGIFNREASVNVIKASNQWRKENFSIYNDLNRDVDFAFGTNPCCVAGNTTVETEDKGPQTVLEIIERFNNREPVKVRTSKGFSLVKNAMATRFDAETITCRFVDDNRNEHYLQMTPDHLVITDGGLIQAQYLRSDYEVSLVDGDKIVTGKFVSFERNADLINTYDIQTETNDFFANGVLIHNSEIILRPKQFCNLSTVIVRADDTLESLSYKVKQAARFGTFQSCLTRFRYISKKWKENTEAERLLGVSMTGIMDHPVLNGTSGRKKRAEWLQALKKVAVAENFELSQRLGIPRSKAITCIKPEGTVSQLSDTASGIHVRYSPYYIRRIRLDSGDPVAKMLADQGMKYDRNCHDKDGWFYNILKKLPFGIWGKIKKCIGGVVYDDKTYIFSFPMKAPDGAMTRHDETALTQLENWLDFQTHWCEHKPSITVSVKDEEWDEVREWVWQHFDKISGISFLPYDGGSYENAPYEECNEKTYRKMKKRIPTLDWDKLQNYESTDLTEGAQNLACVSGGCDF